MNAFDLYFSSRVTTVNSVSRAGRVMARCTARKLASNTMSTAKEAAIASPTKPNDTTIGSRIRATDTPNRFMMWPVTTCSTSVTICVMQIDVREDRGSRVRVVGERRDHCEAREV